MSSRRSFVKMATGAALGGIATPRMSLAAIGGIERAKGLDGRAAHLVAQDEAYWEVIQRAYTQDAGFINLESGYFSPAADPVVDAQVDNLRMINRIPSFYMRRRMAEERVELKRNIGGFADIDPEEFTLVRNTTEALNAVIHGIPLESGEEILYSNREYPSMQEALEQRAQRFGTVNRVIDQPSS